MYHGYRTVWQALGTLTVDNIVKSETDGFFTEEDNDQYLTPYLTQVDGPRFRFNGKIYDRYKFLASWEKIKSHVIHHYVQHISHEPWPGYNDAARKMERWYHYDPREGTGLGKREQGIVESWLLVDVVRNDLGSTEPAPPSLVQVQVQELMEIATPTDYRWPPLLAMEMDVPGLPRS
eukprot:scaffold1649_cov134-Isochrysis_galbana.AAC.9